MKPSFQNSDANTHIGEVTPKEVSVRIDCHTNKKITSELVVHNIDSFTSLLLGCVSIYLSTYYLLIYIFIYLSISYIPTYLSAYLLACLLACLPI